MAEAAAAPQKASAGSGMSVDPVSAAVQAGTAIANTIAGISDMNKRRRFEQSLALLSNRQQQELNEKLMKADSQNQRLQILSDSMVQYAIANETGAAKKETVMYIIAGALAVVILIGAIVYVKK